MRLRSLVCATLLLVACGAAAQPAELAGRWRVNAILTASEIVALDGKEAGALVGQELVATATGVRFAGKTCPAKFERSQTTAADVARDYKVDPKSLRLGNAVTVFDGGCMDVFVRDASTIVFTWNGYFFQATKIKI